MPHSKFYTQTDAEAFKTIAASSSMPIVLTSMSLMLQWGDDFKNRTTVPFADPEAKAACHIVCRAEDKGLYTGLFASIHNS